MESRLYSQKSRKLSDFLSHSPPLPPALCLLFFAVFCFAFSFTRDELKGYRLGRWLMNLRALGSIPGVSLYEAGVKVFSDGLQLVVRPPAGRTTIVVNGFC